MTKSKTIINIYVTLITIFILFMLSSSLFAADINTVFSDVNTKADAIMSWFTDYFVYTIAVVAFVAWGVAMLFKKSNYVEGIYILIIIIVIGFAKTIVGFLINKN